MTAPPEPVEPVGAIWAAAAKERNWLIWRIKAQNGHKPGKLPACPDTGRAPISVYKAAKLTLAEARTAAAKHGNGYGIGYLAREGSKLIGIDLDHAISEEGELEPWAVPLMNLAKRTWAERSPSGRGVRVIAARLHPVHPPVDFERDGRGVFSGGKKFFTITFDLLHGHPPTIGPAGRLTDEILGLQTFAAKVIENDKEDEPDQAHWFGRLSEERQDAEVDRMPGYLTDPKYGDYEEWLRISFAVYDATDSSGFEIWDAWCQRLPNYDGEENSKKWNTFCSDKNRAGGKITVGTLIAEARANGYEPPPEAFIDPGHADLAKRIAEFTDRLKTKASAPEAPPKPTEATDEAKPTAEPKAPAEAPQWRDGMSSADLMKATFKPHRWAVENLLPEGFAIFAGKQKTGKTWWVLELAHAVGEGSTLLGQQCTGGDVLLLLLEDNARRTQSRLKRMGLETGCAQVWIYNTWPTGPEGIDALMDWIEKAPDPRLIIIDTLKQFQGGPGNRHHGDAYEKSVDLNAPLQRLALAAQITILATTHERKDARGSDWMDRITGSLGLASVADTIIMLTRERDSAGALLRVTGRDVEDLEQVLTFDPKACRWTTLNRHPALQAALTSARQGGRSFLNLMIEDDVPRTVTEWAERRGISRQAADKALRQFETAGAVVKSWNDGDQLWEARKANA